MFDNIITLAVDVTNANGAKTNEEYRRYDDSLADRSVYIGPGHALEKRNTLGLYRTQPKKNGTSKGVAKASLKGTEDIDVPGVNSSVTLTSPLIIETSFSVPVGVTKAQLVHAVQRQIAFLDTDDFIERLALKLEV